MTPCRGKMNFSRFLGSPWGRFLKENSGKRMRASCFEGNVQVAEAVVVHVVGTAAVAKVLGNKVAVGPPAVGPLELADF